MMKVLFVGESWKGSSAQSLREGLQSIPDLRLEAISEEEFFPKNQKLWRRAFSRLTKKLHVAAFERELTREISRRTPDVLIVYKGVAVGRGLVEFAASLGALTVNIFPDCSPHAHGLRLRRSLGAYDLVISTKPFHPRLWKATYGYANRCVFVPHGYDPAIHYWPEISTGHDIDVLLIATWRHEYHSLMGQLRDELDDESLNVHIAGSGWLRHRKDFPSWTVREPVHGRAYGELLRRAKIVVAPVSTSVVVGNSIQPGDEDSTRTYELAAAGCFFLHRRTPLVSTLYDDATEVPMWESAAELAGLIRKFLPLDFARRQMAAKAHLRAVPSYSITLRAQAILHEISSELVRRRVGKHAA